MAYQFVTGDSVGDYILEERLGKGGCSEVWRARHHVLKQEVAVKLPLDAASAGLFRREIEALDTLDHQGIVAIKAASLAQDPPFFAMELVAGGSLRQRLRRSKPELEAAEALIRAITEALAAAHEADIVHGDLKPENILLDGDGAPKIGDFGLSRALSEAERGSMAQSLQSEAVSGTFDYMPREVRDGQKPDKRADVFALGLMIFELLVGRLPDVNEKPGDHGEELTRFDALFQACYTRYEDRAENAGAALEKLKEAEAAALVVKAEARPSSAPPPVKDEPKISVKPASHDEPEGFGAVWIFALIGIGAFAFIARFVGGPAAAVFAAAFFGVLAVVFVLPGARRS